MPTLSSETLGLRYPSGAEGRSGRDVRWRKRGRKRSSMRLVRMVTSRKKFRGISWLPRRTRVLLARWAVRANPGGEG